MQILAFYPGFQGQEQKCCLRQSDHMVGEVYLQNMYEVAARALVFKYAILWVATQQPSPYLRPCLRTVSTALLQSSSMPLALERLGYSFEQEMIGWSVPVHITAS